ncbi:BTAD domain-containing putative transcriptional regulator [Streptomyces sp. NPDC018693]|uniref:AfsR/SARP family transcriptional regulator n=1 Tax=unclassified Streptomyces TaxID=2593676 RepID=UPI00379BB79C
MRRYELRFGLLGTPVLYDAGDGGVAEHGSSGVGAGAGSSGAGVGAEEGPSGAGVGPVARSISSPKVRTLLAALLLEAGRVVPVESLLEVLWGGAPPASARASLHNHVTRLRRLLDDPERLRAVPPGYLLRVEQGELDVHVFERHLAAARGAHAAMNWARVVCECAAALALWRGTPLSGLPAEPVGYAFVQRFQEARLLLLEWRYDAELALGGDRLDRVLPELAALAAEHPLRETYHRQLMLALHRTGRRAEALAVHRDLRARLVEELGVEPGRAVREAHAEVLRGAASKGATALGERKAGDSGAGRPCRPDRTSAAMAPPVPAQLPPAPAHFTGRDDDVRRLLHTLAERTGTGGTQVAVISGMAGVGKSALALQVAHTLRERFTDGQLYVDLHGATPGMAPLPVGEALTALLLDLGTDPRRIPEHPDAKTALLRSLLAPTRTLVVLDDAAAAAQVRPLLPAGSGCAVLVTSRSPLTALDGAHRFPLAPLSAQDSAALLRAVSGRDGLDASHPLVELTGRLPLALRIVAARLAARRALTPDVLADQLAATESRLNHLEYDDLSVRRSLAVAHDALAASDRETDRDAALILRHIGTLDLPAYGASLLSHLTHMPEHRTEAALDRLVDVALLQEPTYGRYAPHALVRDFARESAGGAAAGAGVRAGAGAGGGVGGGTRAGVGGPGAVDNAARVGARADAGPGANGPRAVGSTAGIDGPGDAERMGNADGADGLRVIHTALAWYAAVAEHALTAIVAPGPDQDDRRRPTSTQPPAHAALVADLPPFSSPEAAFAWADSELENIVALAKHLEATADTEPAIRPGQAPGMPPVTKSDTASAEPPGAPPATTQAPLSATTPAAQPPAEPSPASGGASGASAGTGASPGTGAAPGVEALLSTLLRLLFPYLQRRGRVAEMEVLGRVALRVARRLGDEAAEAYALGDIAGLRFLTGRHKEALGLTDRALVIWRRLDRLSWIRRCLNNRGLLLEGLGRYAESEDALRQSLEYSRQLGDPHGEAVTHSHLGNLYEHTDPRAAIEQHRRSLAIGEEIGAVIVQHSAHCNIGYAHLTLGEPAAALPHFEESLRVLGGHGDWHGEAQTRLGLVRTLRRLGRTERAAHECAELLRRADARADRYAGGLARHQQGLLLREQGRAQEAYDAWRTALDALDGTDEQAVVGKLHRLLAESGGPGPADHLASA